MTDCKGYSEGFNGRAMATPCQRKAGPSGYCAIHSPEGEAKRRAKAEERDAQRVTANRVKFAKERAIRAVLTAVVAGEDHAEPLAILLTSTTPEELAAHIRAIRL